MNTSIKKLHANPKNIQKNEQKIHHSTKLPITRLVTGIDCEVHVNLISFYSAHLNLEVGCSQEESAMSMLLPTTPNEAIKE